MHQVPSVTDLLMHKGSNAPVGIGGAAPGPMVPSKQSAPPPPIIFSVHPSYVGKIIGRRAKTLNTIKQEYRVNVTVHPEDGKIVIRDGTQENMTKAKAFIENIIVGAESAEMVQISCSTDAVCAWLLHQWRKEKHIAAAEEEEKLLQQSAAAGGGGGGGRGGGPSDGGPSSPSKIHPLKMSSPLRSCRKHHDDGDTSNNQRGSEACQVNSSLTSATVDQVRYFEDVCFENVTLRCNFDDASIEIIASAADAMAVADKAKKAIAAEVPKLKGIAKIRMPRDVIPNVIGKGGLRLLARQEKFAVIIEADVKGGTVRLVGETQEAVDACAEDIEIEFEGQLQRFRRREKMIPVAIEVPVSMLTKLDGKGGYKTAKRREAFNNRVLLDFDRDMKRGVGIVTVYGDDANVAKACAAEVELDVEKLNQLQVMHDELRSNAEEMQREMFGDGFAAATASSSLPETVEEFLAQTTGVDADDDGEGSSDDASNNNRKLKTKKQAAKTAPLLSPEDTSHLRATSPSAAPFACSPSTAVHVQHHDPNNAGVGSARGTPGSATSANSNGARRNSIFYTKCINLPHKLFPRFVGRNHRNVDAFQEKHMVLIRTDADAGQVTIVGKVECNVEACAEEIEKQYHSAKSKQNEERRMRMNRKISSSVISLASLAETATPTSPFPPNEFGTPLSQQKRLPPKRGSRDGSWSSPTTMGSPWGSHRMSTATSGGSTATPTSRESSTTMFAKPPLPTPSPSKKKMPLDAAENLSKKDTKKQKRANKKEVASKQKKQKVPKLTGHALVNHLTQLMKNGDAYQHTLSVSRSSPNTPTPSPHNNGVDDSEPVGSPRSSAKAERTVLKDVILGKNSQALKRRQERFQVLIEPFGLSGQSRVGFGDDDEDGDKKTPAAASISPPAQAPHPEGPGVVITAATLEAIDECRTSLMHDIQEEMAKRHAKERAKAAAEKQQAAETARLANMYSQSIQVPKEVPPRLYNKKVLDGLFGAASSPSPSPPTSSPTSGRMPPKFFVRFDRASRTISAYADVKDGKDGDDSEVSALLRAQVVDAIGSLQESFDEYLASRGSGSGATNGNGVQT